MSSLTNEQIKQIIDGAPDGATTYDDDGYYSRPDVTEWLLSDLAEILTLRERVAELEQGEWIMVDERLPSERCLAFTPNERDDMRYRIIPAGLFKQAATDATHWQPLPQPPKENANERD